MTTETRHTARDSGARVLLGAAAASSVVGVLAVVAGGLAQGRPGALGALVGLAIGVVVFGAGAGIVHVASRLAPTTSLLVALMTYALQLLAVLVSLSALERAGLAGDAVSRGWVVASLIGCVAAWLVAQVLLATRARFPVYELPSTPAGAAAAPASKGGSR